MNDAVVRDVNGAVIRVETRAPLVLGEVAHVGTHALLAEVVALDGEFATLQVYEDTEGLKPGDPVHATGRPLSVELGPGLLGQVFDGVQRPLDRLAASEGDFLGRGVRAPALDRARAWTFSPSARAGDVVSPGDEIGVIRETPAILHRILVPHGVRGVCEWVAAEEPRTVEQEVALVRGPAGPVPVPLMSTWRVRVPRPPAERLPPEAPLVTGQRVLDMFFPIARGGAAGMPGGFGTGKTIMQHQLCRWADADVIVYVGCGERGNEMTEMLRRLPELIDPKTGRPLAERTILVANTSNMPVAAREASLYCGITMAEYYRDMGLHVVLLADSTSRWAEAMRELAGRLGEMPAEEGYPSYLASRLAGYYERAGRVRTLGGREGSVTLISAISPAGGDLTEPVTRHTQRFTRTFWTLDQALAGARVFPAISTSESYSDVPGELAAWWHTHVSPAWATQRQQALELLEEASRVEATARLVGTDALPERQQLLLRFARAIEEGVLRQSAFDPVDAWCAPAKQCALLELLVTAYRRSLAAIDRGVTARAVSARPEIAALERAKVEPETSWVTRYPALCTEFDAACAQLEREASGAPV